MEARWIGLIADSHGNFERTEQAAAALLATGAEPLIHLGDFCDTVQESSWAVSVLRTPCPMTPYGRSMNPSMTAQHPTFCGHFFIDAR